MREFISGMYWGSLVLFGGVVVTGVIVMAISRFKR